MGTTCQHCTELRAACDTLIATVEAQRREITELVACRDRSAAEYWIEFPNGHRYMTHNYDLYQDVRAMVEAWK